MLFDSPRRLCYKCCQICNRKGLEVDPNLQVIITIGAVFTAFVWLRRDISRLSDGVDKIREVVVANKTAIETLTSKVDANGKAIEAIRQDIAAIRQDIAALQRDVAALQRDVAALQRDVAALQRDVAALQRDVAALQKDVAALYKGVADNASAIQALQANVASLRA